MKGFDTEYTRNLEYFLQHSNEDEVDTKYFLRRFLATYQGDRKKLRWLDVGAGPGTKPIQILKGIREYFGNIELDVLEPSEEWQRKLTENFQRAKLEKIISRKYKTTWEDFHSTNEYDLITFFHSVYGIDTESLGRIPQYLPDKGVACIVVESPNSDLHLIKKGIFPHIHHQELISSSDTITAFFEKEKMKCSVDEEETEQRFYVDELLDVANPDRMIPLSFILQTKPEDQDRMASKEVQKKIDAELKKYAKVDEQGSYINVPDRFIWIYQ